MNKNIVIAVLLSLLLVQSIPAESAKNNYRGKKVLYVNSYHKGYYWSDGEQKGAEDVLVPAGVEFKAVYLDARNNPAVESLQKAGLTVKTIIEEFKPDVVITADDDAFAYVIAPYFRNSALPVVFCGINWDISVYGAPYKNTTGMIEISLIGQLYEHLKKFARGPRVGVIAYDVANERKHTSYFNRYIRGDLITLAFVKDFESWKKEFLALQSSVDMIIFAAPDGIRNWDLKQAVRFVNDHLRVPTGATALDILPAALMGISRIPEEQGEYAARAALQIIDGKKPSQIPIVTNRKGDLYLNPRIAGKLDIIFSPSMLRNAKALVE